MAKNDLGRTIIDELKLCYVAELSLLDELSQIQLGGWADYDKFTIFRVVCEHYQYGFDVLYTSISYGRKKVATFKFGRYGEQRFPQYVIYRIENETLYDQELLNTTLRFPEMLGVEFEHITSIDLCRDYKFNVVSKIRKIAKEPADTISIDNLNIIIGWLGIPFVHSLNKGFYFPSTTKEKVEPYTGISENLSMDVLELIGLEAMYKFLTKECQFKCCPLYGMMCWNSSYSKLECFETPWLGDDCIFTIVSAPLNLKNKNIHW